jgi:hypothetical protein
MSKKNVPFDKQTEPNFSFILCSSFLGEVKSLQIGLMLSDIRSTSIQQLMMSKNIKWKNLPASESWGLKFVTGTQAVTSK